MSQNNQSQNNPNQKPGQQQQGGNPSQKPGQQQQERPGQGGQQGGQHGDGQQNRQPLKGGTARGSCD